MTEPTLPAAAGARLGALDSLRGLAALAVVLFHFTTRYDVVFGHNGMPLIDVWWGHFGVNLFFGISGFVIFLSLSRTRRITDFVVSRFSRLYPAYWTAILLTTAVVSLGILPELQRSFGTVLINLTMIQGAIGVPHVDGVYWTLLVELVFYVMMTIIAAGGWLGRIELALIAWISLKWLWWLAPTILGVELPYRLGLLLLQEYIPYFAIGIGAFRLTSKAAGWRHVVPVMLFAIVSAAIIDGLLPAVSAVVSAVLLLGVGFGRFSVLAAAPLVALGTISYSLYLLHENIGWTIIAAAERAGVPTNLAILLALAVVLALATLVTRLVEQPAMRWIRDRYRARRQRQTQRALAT